MLLCRLLASLVLLATVGFTAPVPIEIIKVGGVEYPVFDTKDVRFRFQVRPVYPAAAKADRRGGRTTVGAVVDEKGKVIGVFVESSDAKEDIRKAACAAVKAWRFYPIETESGPIRFVTFIPVVMQVDET